MKRYILYLAVIVLFFCSSPVLASDMPDEFTTGEDWKTLMNDREKLMAILIPMNFLQGFGVSPEKKAPDYLPEVDRFLKEYPVHAKEDVVNIFANTLYAYEPQTRKPLERLEFELNKFNSYGEGSSFIRILEHPDVALDSSEKSQKSSND